MANDDEKINCNASTDSNSTAETISCEERYKHTPYGSLPSNGSFRSPTSETTFSSSRRIIYCVHGKPSGCCIITEDEMTDRNGIRRVSGESAMTASKDHCHQTRDNGIDKNARRKLIIASILCVIFMIAEIVGGYLSSSLAIMTDAAHLLTDFVSFMISLLSLWIGSRPPTRKMSFGWYRAEVIGALTSVLLIWVITGILVYLAVLRIVNFDFEIEAKVMLITSSLGVLVNIIMGCTLHSHGHGHSHNHKDNHDVATVEGQEKHEHKRNINVRAAFIHVVGDFLQSIGVFVAALIIYFKPTWIIVDPICTFIFSVLVLLTTCAIIKDTMNVLMEGMPQGVDFSEVLNTILEVDGVIKVHNLRIWALSMDKIALSAHIAISPGSDAQKILNQATQDIYSKFSFFEMTLQIEDFDSKMENCVQCKCPER